MKLTSITAMVLALLLSGCGNLPTSMGKLPAKRSIVEAYGSTPNYNAADKFSFLQAALLYPASGGHHRIEIGERVLSDTFEALGASPITALRLVQFSAVCEAKGSFPVAVFCPANYRIELEVAGAKKTIQGSVAAVDLGAMVAREGTILFVPITLGDGFYHQRIEPFMEALASDLSKRIKDALPQ